MFSGASIRTIPSACPSRPGRVRRPCGASQPNLDAHCQLDRLEPRVLDPEDRATKGGGRANPPFRRSSTQSPSPPCRGRASTLRQPVPPAGKTPRQTAAGAWRGSGRPAPPPRSAARAGTPASTAGRRRDAGVGQRRVARPRARRWRTRKRKAATTSTTTTATAARLFSRRFVRKGDSRAATARAAPGRPGPPGSPPTISGPPCSPRRCGRARSRSPPARGRGRAPRRTGPPDASPGSGTPPPAPPAARSRAVAAGPGQDRRHNLGVRVPGEGPRPASISYRTAPSAKGPPGGRPPCPAPAPAPCTPACRPPAPSGSARASRSWSRGPASTGSTSLAMPKSRIFTCPSR